MPRLARRSAGDQVVAQASRLSDDLLDLEEACFAEIDGEFESRAPLAEQMLVAAYRRAKDDPTKIRGDARLLTELADLHAEAMAASRSHVAALAGLAREAAIDSIEIELGFCEETLATKYDGIAVEATRAGRERSEALVTARLVAHEDEVQAGQAAFVGHVRTQFQVVAARQDALPVAARRLLAEKALSLPGNGGRGVWWRATSGLKRSAREVSIRLASTIRLAAMEEFNDAATARQ